MGVRLMGFANVHRPAAGEEGEVVHPVVADDAGFRAGVPAPAPIAGAARRVNG